MAHEAPKTDGMTKIVTVVAAVALLATVGYQLTTLADITTRTPFNEAYAAKAEEASEKRPKPAPTKVKKADKPAAVFASLGAGEAAAGEAKYKSTCVSCHGANQEGGIGPKLAGQSNDDIQVKLQKYRAGEQMGATTAVMAPMAAGLSDDDIKNVAAFIGGEVSAAAKPASEAPAADAVAGDAVAGEAMYKATCAACHGANQEGGIGPKLAGQSNGYIQTKLEKYRAGEQMGATTAVMAPMAAGLSDADIANVAAYIGGTGGASSAEEMPEKNTSAGDVVAGESMFNAVCASCHGMNAEGGIGPKLAGQASGDLVAKLNKYRAGEEVGPMTAIMAPMAAPLSDADIENVTAFLSTK